MNKPIIALLVLASLFSSVAQARTCRIIYLQAPKSAPKELYLFDGLQSQKVDLPSMNFSPVYEVAGGNSKLYLSSAPIGVSKKINPAAPSVKVPAKVRDLYLLIRQDKDNAYVPVSMHAIDAGMSRFGKSQMLWLNFTKSSIAAKVGNEKIIMKPFSQKVIPAPKETSFNANVYFSIPGDDRARPLCETKWQRNPAARQVIFIFNKGKSRAPRILGFADHR